MPVRPQTRLADRLVAATLEVLGEAEDERAALEQLLVARFWASAAISPSFGAPLR